MTDSLEVTKRVGWELDISLASTIAAIFLLLLVEFDENEIK